MNEIPMTPDEAPRSARYVSERADLRKDPRYRKYVQAMERILQSFDSVNEWADVIKFLSNLSKTLSSHAEFRSVPLQVTVAKRLAQCLNPALPSGVHSKALEVYALIFKNIQADGMASDLALYSYGLFGLLPHATMSVKPQLLKLFAEFYLPLGDRLKPCLKSFIIAILPGMDEENSEFFNDTKVLVDSIRKKIGSPFFFSCFHLAMTFSPQHRLAAVNYLAKSFPTIRSRDDVNENFGSHFELLVHAFVATLSDNNILVQRGVLELIVSNFPFNRALADERHLCALTKAVLGVVLKKEMSLNRRVYSWVLSASEDPEEQEAYLTKYAMKPLVNAFNEMLFCRSTDIQDLSRPYKIIITLMDRADIGIPLVDALFPDILTSLQFHSQHSGYSELLQTAGMFFDMLEPHTIWRRIYSIFISAIQSHDDSTLTLISSFITRIHLRDEDSFGIFMPYLYILMCDVLARLSNQEYENWTFLKATQDCAALLLKKFPEYALLRLSTPKDLNDPSASLTIENIHDFFQQPTEESYNSALFKNAHNVLTSNFLTMVRDRTETFLSRHISQNILTKKSTVGSPIVHIFKKACQMMEIYCSFTPGNNPVDVVCIHTAPNTSLKPEWLDHALKCCVIDVSFEISSISLSLLFFLINHDYVPKSVFTVSHSLVTEISQRLWAHLSPAYSQHHELTTRLLWQLSLQSPIHAVENCIMSYLSDPCFRVREQNFVKFGIFWRLSESMDSTAIVFSRPLFFMVDMLKSNIPQERRAAETFLKCSLKSLTRLLDPILLILLDPSVSRITRIKTMRNDGFTCVYYRRMFNQSQIDFIFRMLLEVFQYGGPQLVLNLHHMVIRNSTIVRLVKVYDHVNRGVSVLRIHKQHEQNYLELLLALTLDFFNSEVDADQKQLYEMNIRIQCRATEVLHYIVSHGQDLLGASILAELHNVSLTKLIFCIDSGDRFDMQTRILSMFHSSFPALDRVTPWGSKRDYLSTSHSDKSEGGTVSPLSKADNSVTDTTPSVNPHPLFVRILLEALTSNSNRTVFPYYLDFLISSLTFFQHLFRSVLLPVIQCLCEQLSLLTTRMESISKSADNESENTYPIDIECILLLNCLEKTVSYCFMHATWESEPHDVSDIPRKPNDSSNYGFRGLTDLVAGVFVGDANPEQFTSDQKARVVLLSILPELTMVLNRLWNVVHPQSLADTEDKPENDSLVPISSANLSLVELPDVFNILNDISLSSSSGRIEMRIKKLLDTYYKLFPVNLHEAIVITWVGLHETLQIEDENDNVNVSIFHLFTSLKNYSAIITIESLLDLIKERQHGGSMRDRIQLSLHLQSRKLVETDLLRFIEVYVSKVLSPDELSAIYPSIFAMIRDYLALTNIITKTIYFSLFRLFTSLLLNAPSSLLEDKKNKRESYDLYQRLADSCILIAGRSFDTGLWRRRESSSGETADVVAAIRDKASNNATKEQADDSKRKTASPSLKIERGQEILIRQITQYLAKKFVVEARKIIPEHDRLFAIMTNIVYYVIGPNLKSRHLVPYNRLLNTTLDLLHEVSKISSVYKTWRKDAWDSFTDMRFFTMTLANSYRWKRVMQSIIQTERDRLDDVLTKISTPTVGLFSSKEQEINNKSLLLRKATFIIFCGERDQFLTQLPVIQEKIVEIFKQPYSALHTEVYLCLRVLLLKMTTKHLSNSWPVVITELVRLFRQILKNLKAGVETSEGILVVFLAACKLIDLALVMAAEELQIYQWIFISETVDALTPLAHQIKQSLVSSAYFDRLAWRMRIHTVDLGMAESNESLAAEITDETLVAPDNTQSLLAVSLKRHEAASKISLSMSQDVLSDSEVSGAPDGKLRDMSSQQGLYRRRPLIPSSLSAKTIKSLEQLLPFFENISQWTFETLQQTVVDHYNPFPALFDPQPMSAVSKQTETTVLNKRTIDEEYIEEWIQHDFVDDGTSYAADIRPSVDPQ